MKEKVLTLLIGIMALLLLAVDVQAQTATIETDKADYQPGDTVVITGSGWLPGETVKLEIDHSSVSHGNSILYATADLNGAIMNHEFLILQIHLGEVFNLTAIGLSSLLTANTVFTDANFTSKGSGNWSSAATWNVAPGTDNDGIPDSDDIVRIESGHTVYVISAGNGTAGSVIVGSSTMNGTAVLELQGSGVLDVSGSLTLGEGLSRFGSLRFTGAGTLSIGSNFTAPQLKAFSPGTGTIDYKGNGSQTILSTAALGGVPYHHVTMSNSRASSKITLSNFSLTGNYTDNATFASGYYININSNVNFTGTTNQRITGWGNKTLLGDITINNSGADNNNIVEVYSDTFAASTGFLSLIDGIFKFSRPFPITPFSLISDVPAAAGFWNNGGTVSMLDGIKLSGLIRNSSGTIRVGNSNLDNLSYTTGSAIIIESGTVNIVGALRPFTTGSTITYNQSAGTLIVGTISASYSSTGMFDISAPSSSFSMSGGSIVIERNNTSLSVPDYINLASTYNITGGTLQVGNSNTPAGQTIKIKSTVPIFNLLVDATSTTKIAQLITNGLIVKKDLRISGGTLNANNLPLNIAGNWSNSGTFMPGSGTVTFNGTLVQAIEGSAITAFNNLTLSNSSGLKINAHTSIGGILNFQEGLITPNTGTLTIESSGSSINANSTNYVNGKLGWVIPNTLTKIFPIGNGAEYRPVAFKYNSVSGVSTVRIEQFESSLTGPLPANTTIFDERYWDISQTGGSNLDFNITLDPTGFTPTGNVRILMNESGILSSHETTSPNYTNSTGLTSLAATTSFALGETFTTTTTKASSAVITYGDVSVTLSALVSPTPTSGTVTFFVDETAVGISNIDANGVSSLVYDPQRLNASSHLIRAEFNGSEGYDASSSGPSGDGILTINKKELTASLTGTIERVYKGSLNATLVAGNYSLPGILNGDVVSLNNPTSGSYDTKNVGTDKTVSVSGLSIDGAGAGNYSLSNTFVNANIGTITPLVVTGNFTAGNKVYDGHSDADILTRTLNDVIALDDVALAGGTAAFADKNVNNDKTVTLIDATLAGGDAGNYSLAYVANTSANITALAINGNFTAANKVYDGNNSATAVTRTLNGVVSSDIVTLTGGTATFDNKTVETGKTVTLTGATLAGADKDNYTLTSVVTATGNITTLVITGTFASGNKVYDGNTSAIVTNRSLVGSVPADDVTLNGGTATFDTRNIGTGKTVTLAGPAIAGTDAGNYTLSGMATTVNSIFARPISGTFNAENKVYDGNTLAIVTNRSLVGNVSADDVTLDGGTATFDTRNIGTGKAVTLAGAAIAGIDAGNYTLSGVATTVNSIFARPISGTFNAENKVYDGNTSAIVTNRSLVDNVPADDITLDGGTATFDTRNIGTGKTVTLAGAAIAGIDAGNYTLSGVATTANSIFARPISGTFIAENKVYDGSTSAILTKHSLVGVVPADDVTLGGGTATFDTRSIGTGKTVTLAGAAIAGTDAGNYILSGVATTANSIFARPITITAAPKSKYCGALDPELKYSLTAGILVQGEIFSGSLIRDPGESSGATYTINQGNVTVNTNYAITYIPADFNIYGVYIDANANATPQPVKTSATSVIISVTSLTGGSAPGVSVTLYVDSRPSMITTADAAGIATFNVGILATDVYKLRAVAGLDCNETTVYMPIYDPTAGFVTGGGWIISPAGAYAKDLLLTGKANFGFVAKYKKGSSAVEGNTEFQFQTGNLSFTSSTYTSGSLVIATSKAIYKGVGTINGIGNYGFMVSALDGQVTEGGGVDKFRIKIWDKNELDKVVYDNGLGADENIAPPTKLGGGSIVIHEIRGGKLATTSPIGEVSKGLDMTIIETTLDQKIKLGAYPNPFAQQATIAFTLPSDEQLVTLDVYDLKGSKISRMYEGKASANQRMEFNFNGSNLSAGMYFLRLTTPTKVENFKMIMIE